MRIDRVAFATELARADLSLKELSVLTGVSRQTISAVKKGKSCSVTTTARLVAVLGNLIIKQKEAGI